MIRTILLVAIAMLTLHKPAFAYLDPGSAAMITQLIIGTIAAVGTYLGHRFRVLQRMLGLGKKDQEEKPEKVSDPE